MNRQRSFIGFFVAGAIALLVIAIAGFYWFFAKSPANLIASSSGPGAAIFVSKLSPAMVSLLTNPDRLQALEREEELSKLKTSLFAKSGIDYKQDIQPWLGNEITLAIATLDIDRDPENGQQPGYLLALATKQPQKSREFVELLFSKRALAGANLAVEQYKGVKLISDNSQPEQDLLAGAVVGESFVLFANDPKVLKDAINNVQAPDLNLTSSPEYQKVTKERLKGGLAVAFLNLPIVAKWQGLELPEQLYNSQIISLVLNPQGLLAETTILTSSEIVPASAPLSKPVGALQYVPASAGLAISGSNLSNLGDSDLAKLWRQATATIYGSGEDVVSRLAKPLADVQKRWGINLPKDIFSWVQGEYAIALLPDKEQTTPHWIFVVEKSEGVEQGVARLDAIASSNGLSINTLNIDKQKISAWTELTTATKKSDVKEGASFSIETKVQGLHTTLGNYEIFASDLETINEILTTKDNSIIDNPNFKDSIAAIPLPNQGYIYLDWTKSQNLLERQVPILKLVEVLGNPFFNNLRSLTVSSYGTDTRSLKGGVFFKLHNS
ncbi:DUF3352 domain-containing protein [Nostoc sp. 'Lobaria pulmonaria (5183) cyanobiont']|uniref:DUF3352 domain-containing protein n=1 Tax=Nostoc sp. 'Lobaria pulmonaria (5183) cyanobiont' TaxID=1618022 RepID=UPI000CF3231F|nr:DUF3352 domain-containing protein [Nostoc sp. 'Lobaria pulmonaria (5183) cyanobiont']AVH70371.1 protein of unknown function DUF3352 [Nostoc sp. 'Lobaria pulmonaria (5183) cyanobiont']